MDLILIFYFYDPFKGDNPMLFLLYFCRIYMFNVLNILMAVDARYKINCNNNANSFDSSILLRWASYSDEKFRYDRLHH